MELNLLPFVASREMGKRILSNKGDGKLEKVMKVKNLLSKMTFTTLSLVIEEKEKKNEGMRREFSHSNSRNTDREKRNYLKGVIFAFS